MNQHDWKEESLIETTVAYTVESNGQFFFITDVTARVNEETVEQFFSAK